MRRPQGTGINAAKLRLSSKFQIDTLSAQRIADLAKKVGGEVYYGGRGAVAYQDADLYESNGIRLEYQEFKFKPYEQRRAPSFVQGLSIIDALLQCGIDETRQLLSM